MTFLRTIMFFAGLLALAACATRTLKPEQAPEYVITRDFTPLYQQRPRQGAVTDVSLKEKTRIKVLRKESAYSFVLLEDSRTGYVANKNMTVAPPGTNTKPFGSSATEAKPKPRRKKHVPTQNAPASPTPTPAVSSATSAGPSGDAPSQRPSPAPAADLQVAPSETPAPAPKPSPTPAPDKPKFRL
jgi:hypothetical protein